LNLQNSDVPEGNPRGRQQGAGIVINAAAECQRHRTARPRPLTACSILDRISVVLSLDISVVVSLDEGSARRARGVTRGDDEEGSMMSRTMTSAGGAELSQVQVQATPQAAENHALKLVLALLSGPVAFFIVQAVPLAGLDPRAHFGLSCYAWVLAWWVSAPIPWAVTGFLPLALFPLTGAMSFADTIGLYGQRVFPFLMGVMLFGHAFSKHGLARRMAMTVLSVPGVATSGARLILMIMCVSAVVSSLVDDAATVAIMIPIAVSVARFATDTHAKASAPGAAVGAPRLLEGSCLAVLYGATAGGMATPAGVPFNPLTISILEQLTGYSITFAQWTLTGVVLAVATLPVYYFALIFMAPPEVKSIPDGATYFEREKKLLGPMSAGERNVMLVLVVMIVLWFLPAAVTIRFLDIWYVPPVAMLLLFLLPTNARRGEMTLGSKDFQDGVLWNVLFLVVSGTALAAGLARLGVADWLGGLIKESGSVSAAVLPWFAAIVTPIMSHLTSGTATTSMISTMLYPIAEDVGYNGAILARIIAGTALAVSFPWGGAASGSAFASGQITFGSMFRIGVVVTVLSAVVITILSMLIVPAFGAFTVE
jgi:sodium-dependent dicarboxylate transporter 2/3/5